MDLISDLGALALGSRLKRLSDRMMKSVSEIYRNSGLDFESKWFPLFYLLSKEGEKGIMENLTHQFERTLITQALKHTAGRKIEAALLLGLGRNTLTRKVQELGLDDGGEA